jgi:glycosyltransferase involved in cell wall biosynthesis
VATSESELKLFLPPDISYRDWLPWVRDAEAVLADHVVRALPHAELAVDKNQRGDVIAFRNDGEVPIAIELKVWRFSPKNLNNRIAEALSAAVLLRRDFNTDVQLGLLVGLVDTPLQDRPHVVVEDKALSRLSRLIRRDSGDAGFDRLVVGILDEQARWREIGPKGNLTPLESFRQAVNRLALPHPRPGNDHERSSHAAAKSSRSGSKPEVLLIADEWRSTQGGISTFNRELAIAFSGAGCGVHVVVPAAEQDERDEALAHEVNLVTPDAIPGVEGHQLLLTRPRFAEEGYRPDVIVGHGRVLGPYAYTAQNLFFPAAKRIHVVHTDAERLELVKGPREGRSSVLTADERRQVEVELSLSADLVAGVGPLLAEWISDAMRGTRREVPEVVDLRPGLRDWGGTVDPSDPPRRRQVLLIARAEDLQSKGIDIAANAVARAIGKFENDVGDAPVLVVRGVPRSHADEIKNRIEEVVAPEVSVIARPYSADPDALRRDLWQSRAVVMPSRHEGFGLVALEALSAGIPILVSRESGIGRVLRDVVVDGERTQPREILPVLGSVDEIAEIWGDALYEVLVDPKAAFRHAAELRDEIAPKMDWSVAVQKLLRSLATPASEEEAA